MSENTTPRPLERRVRRVGNETMPGIQGSCSFYSFGAIRGVPLLRPTIAPYRVAPNNYGSP